MTPPLSKTTKTGQRYQRTASVTAAIERVQRIGLAAALEEVAIEDRRDPRFIESECLLHLLRATRFDNRDDRFARLFALLLDRVARALRGSIRPSRLYDADEVRQDVLDRFTDLLVADRNTPGDRLDYFEVRFAHALAALRIDAIRAAGRAAATTDPIEEMRDEGGDDLPSLTRQIRLEFALEGAEQERERFRNEVLRAIDRLPGHERLAVTLVLEGFPIEGDGANTIAKLCGVTDRAIRYRLKSAYETLRHELGERR